jgi:hypothetical protein
MTPSPGLIEREWLDRAERFCFRARLDRAHYDGPVFERGEGSVVWDVCSPPLKMSMTATFAVAT